MKTFSPTSTTTKQVEDSLDWFEVSIVIPCLNEAETLGTVIRKANLAIALPRLHAEIIVADNGSTDGSQQIAMNLGAEVVAVEMRGYGAALQAGIECAKGNYIIMGDADDSYDFTAIFPFIQQLRMGFDLVMGCRLPQGGGTLMPGAMPWLHRWIGNPVLSGLGRLFFGSPVTDFHCGLRGFSRTWYATQDIQSTGMEFASEMVMKATLHSARITEIPITLHKDGRNRPPHLRTWRDGWRHLRFMLLYSPRWLFLIPGYLLFVTGAFLSGLLVMTPLTIGGVTFSTNTLLVSCMTMLLGFNLLTFSIFSKIFAISMKLLRPDSLTEQFFKKFSLELGLCLGSSLCLLGLIFIGSEVLTWIHSGFGPLPYYESQRIVILGTTMLILGVETIFSSFLLSLFLLPRRERLTTYDHQ
jgi:glycosyltransferase involved in cell wall biosynthesis